MPQNAVIDKKRLVTACQTGNREAQALLYTTYRCKMLKIIRQYDSNKKMILQKIGIIDRGDLIGL